MGKRTKEELGMIDLSIVRMMGGPFRGQIGTVRGPIEGSPRQKRTVMVELWSTGTIEAIDQGTGMPKVLKPAPRGFSRRCPIYVPLPEEPEPPKKAPPSEIKEDNSGKPKGNKPHQGNRNDSNHRTGKGGKKNRQR